ncbi:uncharacterized protein N7459_000407 [Penicillium hispanicum]|uniref:uncharacterized protein n=1 Tax=Penicillium hispanicum TaxID=1080232 RepID=UPI0025416F3F|nr:uncharacterized protein N7459_000407 [Penicillium hispanicum]KAJ5594199.1 hypothetical protein N7459_000407 [Penicillium hispanicum]
MADDGDLRQEILQKTLKEVADEETEGADPCVICLETIAEPCIAAPCNHTNFDYLCLISWLEQQPNCPLCKTLLTTVRYDLKGAQGPKTYKVPTSKPSGGPPGSSEHRRGHFTGPTRARNRRPRPHPRPQFPPSDDPLSVRRNVYRHQLYSLRVGSNRLSQYTEVTPDQFNRDEALVSRARKWIRRELQVFSFLNPEAETEETRGQDRVPRPGHQRLEERRANNAEFLLEYVIAILRTVDLKGSAGQAEELLRDFIGRENARLFLHELLAWLRSPYVSLQDWDRHVQYPSAVQPSRHTRDRDEGRRAPRPRDRSASPYRGNDRSLFERVSSSDRPGTVSQRGAPRSRPSARRPWPPRDLLDRYIPD